jgi:hypothetical protein
MARLEGRRFRRWMLLAWMFLQVSSAEQQEVLAGKN